MRTQRGMQRLKSSVGAALLGDEAYIARHRRQRARRAKPGPAYHEVDPAYLEVSLEFVRSRFGGHDFLYWHEAYARANGIQDPRYIPEDVFFARVEPRLNTRTTRPRQPDKIVQMQMLPNARFPVLLGTMVRGRIFDRDRRRVPTEAFVRDVAAGHDRVVIKLADGSAGVGFRLLDAASEDVPAVLAHAASVGQDLVVQAPIVQHAEMARLNPTSVNTMRIVTLRVRDRILVASCVARVGRAGSVVDNQAQGGIAIGVSRDGALKTFGYDKGFVRHDAHPDSGVRFSGFAIPSGVEAMERCRELHAELVQYDIVSWDVAIDAERRPVVIELNVVSMELNFLQVNNGPLLGEHTDEILEEIHAGDPWCPGSARLFLSMPSLSRWPGRKGAAVSAGEGA